MISFLKGILAKVSPSFIIIDVNGVGYKIFVPTSAYYVLPQAQEEIVIHTYLHVREDALQLYGFLNEEDLSLFEILINVSGIGPKNGLAILSNITPQQFKGAVIKEDLGILTKIPGIGKKTAQRMILELKDKIKIEEIKDELEVPMSTMKSNLSENALEALLSLGYQRSEAKKALESVANENIDGVEVLIKEALKQLAKG